uniref:uncharacterized protein LOC120343837 n=1 Tax=Styela clava TaxID=7725 RepID=UPI001939A926|nr:uncharacterized protein LOC120343837 [Styela clava]
MSTMWTWNIHEWNEDKKCQKHEECAYNKEEIYPGESTCPKLCGCSSSTIDVNGQCVNPFEVEDKHRAAFYISLSVNVIFVITIGCLLCRKQSSKSTQHEAVNAALDSVELGSAELEFSPSVQSENSAIPDDIDDINKDSTIEQTGETGLPSTAIKGLSNLDRAFQILDKNVRTNVVEFNTHVFCLPFEECEKIEHEVSTSSGQIRAGFAKWKEVNGKEATVELLIKKLRRIGRNDIVHEIEDELRIVFNTGFSAFDSLDKAFKIFEGEIEDIKHAVEFFRIQLELEEREIPDLQKRDTTHFVLQCLNIWKEKQGKNATVEHFIELLRNASLTYITEEVSRKVQISCNEGAREDEVNAVTKSHDIESSYRQSTEIPGENSEDALETRPKYHDFPNSTRQAQNVTADVVAKMPSSSSGDIKSGKGEMRKDSCRGNTIAKSKSYNISSSTREAQNVTEIFDAKLSPPNSGDMKPKIEEECNTEDKTMEEITFIDESGPGKCSRSTSFSVFTHSKSMSGEKPRKKQNKAKTNRTRSEQNDEIEMKQLISSDIKNNSEREFVQSPI